MKTIDLFNKEMEMLRSNCGDKAADMATVFFTFTLRWLRKSGQGDVKFSAFNHVIGPKWRVDTVHSIDKST